MGSHAGDLSNFTADEEGNAAFEVLVRDVTLLKGESYSLFKEGGTAIIIHAGPDDNVSDPAGAAGSRIAGGTIVKVTS